MIPALPSLRLDGPRMKSTNLDCTIAGGHQHQSGPASPRQRDQQPGRRPPAAWGAHPLPGLQADKAAAGVTVLHLLQSALRPVTSTASGCQSSHGQLTDSCVGPSEAS